MFRLERRDAEDCLLTELGGGEWNQADLRQALLQVIRGHVPVANLEIRKSFSELGTRTIRIEARKLQDDPHHGELVLVGFEDVSERHRAAQTVQEYGAIIDMSRDAVILQDFNGPIRHWNETAARAYGWPASAALGKSADLLLKTRRAVDYEQIDRALNQDGHWEGEQIHATRDGRELRVRTRLVLLKHDDGSRAVLQMDRLPEEAPPAA
jgi:PAS domain S-box-containing protein